MALNRSKRAIILSLLFVFIAIAIASCTPNVQEAMGELINESEVVFEKETDTTEEQFNEATPGHIIIGQLNPNMSTTQVVPESVLSVYTLSSGATMQIKNFHTEKELIEAARQGEVDIVFGNNLVAFLLGHEDNLVDLEPFLSETLSAGDYYTNIIDAGRIHGKLVMITPQFSLGNALLVPENAVLDFGGAPNDFESLLDFYYTLEPEYRAYGAELYSSITLIHGATDLANYKFDVTNAMEIWRRLLSQQAVDGEIEELYYENQRCHSLFQNTDKNEFADPSHLTTLYQRDDGTIYTKYGPKAMLIPFTYTEGVGFSIESATYCIPKQAQNQSAALHLINWLISEEGQEAGRERTGNWTGHACPILRSQAQHWFLQYRNYTENMYTVEEQQAIAEAYIAQADHIPVYSRTLYETVYELLNATGGKDIRDEYVNMLTTTEVSENLGGEEYAENNAARAENWKILFEFFEKFEHEEETPKFYQDGALDIWPELVNDYVRAYITDLGYEMH